jgi:hypothetical protein
LIGVAVEGGYAAIQTMVVIPPADALARAERIDRLVLVEPQRSVDLPGVRQEDRARLVGEHQGLLRRELVRLARGVIVEVAAGDLAIEPLPHVPLRTTAALSDSSRAERALAGHGFVEPELVAEVHHHPALSSR